MDTLKMYESYWTMGIFQPSLCSFTRGGFTEVKKRLVVRMVVGRSRSRRVPVGFGWKDGTHHSESLHGWYMVYVPRSMEMVDSYLWIGTGKYTGIPVPWSQVWVYILAEKDLFPGDSWFMDLFPGGYSWDSWWLIHPGKKKNWKKPSSGSILLRANRGCTVVPLLIKDGLEPKIPIPSMVAWYIYLHENLKNQLFM